jgi:hypothetical protein
MVKRLNLEYMKDPISAAQFVAICELSNLEALTIFSQCDEDEVEVWSTSFSDPTSSC